MLKIVYSAPQNRINAMVLKYQYYHAVKYKVFNEKIFLPLGLNRPFGLESLFLSAFLPLLDLVEDGR